MLKKMLSGYSALPSLLFLFILTRVIFIYFAHPLYLYIFRMEELYRGAMAMELIHGTLKTFYQYRPDDYAGGSFVIAGLTSLFYRTFPQNAFTLKMVSVLWSSGTLAVWFRAVERFKNTRTAVLFSLMFIFCPPAFLRYMLAPIGDHAETVLFAGAELLILSFLLKERKSSLALSFILGVIAGFGTWFAYIHIFVVLSMAIFWRIAEPRLFRNRAFWVFAFAFFVGFSPWIVMNLKEKGIGLVIQGQPWWTGIHAKNFIKRLWHFRESTPYLLFSYFDLFDPPFLASKVVIWFYRILFISPLAAAAWMLRKQKTKIGAANPLVMISLIYVFLFSVLVQFTEYTAVRYWIPAQPFLFLLVLFSLEQISKKVRNIPGLFFVFLISAAILFTARLMSFSERGYAVRQPAVSHAWLSGSPVCSNSVSCLSAYRYFRDQLTEDEKRSLVLDLSIAVASDLSFENLAASLDRAEQELPQETLGIFYYALGYEIYSRSGRNLEKALARVNEQIRPRPEKYYRLCIWGVMDVGMNEFEPVSTEEMTRIQALFPEFALREYWRKRGFEWMQALIQTKSPRQPLRWEIDSVLKTLKLENFPSFVQGVGMGLYGHWRKNQQTGYVTPEVFKSLLPRIRTAMIEGGGIASSKLPEWDQRVMGEMFFRIVGEDARATFERSARFRDLELDALGYNFN